ncbi:MAG: single-stranded DNA-binding protein [Gemmataceae bacterium]
MANFNKVMLIGRLTRDPETRAFSNGGMVAKFGFAVTNRRKNSQTGQWEDEPMFIDCEAFNRGEFGKLADIVRDRCHKGSQIMLEGRLHLDTWDDKNNPGQKRSKHKIVVENIQLLDPRPGGPGGGTGGGEFGGADDGMDAPPPARAMSRPPAGRPPAKSAPPPADEDGGQDGDNIPF